MVLTGQSDHELLGGICRGDAAAFEVFFARHRGAVRRHLLGIVRNADTAEDLVQESFLKVWQHAEQWDNRGACKAWLLRIATNLALNLLRAQQRRQELPLELPEACTEDDNPAPGWMIDALSLGPEALAELSEQHGMLRTLIDRLPEEKREVIRLVHEEELDIRQAAEQLGVPEGTVKSRLHHARKRLAEEWREMNQ